MIEKQSDKEIKYLRTGNDLESVERFSIFIVGKMVS